LHAAVVIALAAWVRSPSTAIGAVAAAGQLAAAFVAWREARRFAAASFVLIGAATGALVVADARSALPSATGAVSVRAASFEHELANAVAETQRRLVSSAAEAAAGARPSDALPPLSSDAGLILYSGDSAVAWSGRTVVPTDRLWERSGVVVTPLYVVQYAAALHGARRAVATNVLSARAPADRLTRALTSVVGANGAARFDVVPASGGPPGGTTVDVGGARLTIVATPQDPAAGAAAAAQSARSRGTFLLLLATLLSLATLWRRAERLPERLLVTAIPLAALAITPLNTLSNVTRLFDPSTYYVDLGGPFTASIGALGITSALVLFAVMAAVRAQARPRRRWGAVLVVLVVAGVGPFLLRALARGVNLPPSGAGTELWLAWEVALFLAATSFLAAGVSAGQWALGTARRGLPLWIAPVLAAGASLAGPGLLRDAALWPAWYPVLWIAAIAALVLGRRSRAVLFSSAFVAACGATVLLWGATLRERVELASHDVETMAVVDTNAVALLQRFADDLAHAPVAKDNEQLLAHYAAADLADAEYAVVLAHWPANGAPTLLPLGGDARTVDVAPVVDVARKSGQSQLRPLVPNPAAALVLAVPHASGDVTSVVVSARTRLMPPHGFVELVGLSPPPPHPPYELTVAGVASEHDSVRASWRRLPTHLHSEWHLRSGLAETAHVVADVTFDGYDTLLSHGLLIVLLDLFVVVILLMGGLLADGALARWIRMRSGRWRRSYRLQLTFALFAFFVVPALAFALWSYRRLQDDDRSSRELVVRETLRRATVSSDPRGDNVVPEILMVPGDVPRLTYRRGQLVAATDSLLLSLAPIGLWLDPDVGRALANADEFVVTSSTPIGGREMLFGFRALSSDIVAAVPARRDDAALDKRRNDLGVLVILATVLGALAALGLSGVAARKLAQPIGTLRTAALAVAGGSREPLDVDRAPAEFVPVFRAFDRMSRDLAESEAQLTRAERVFAWGEMARQVAHEIKNPLTPMRLGVQHVMRAWRDRRPDFGAILEQNSASVLREIDHLDATARSFSRFGTPPDVPVVLENVDVASVVRDVAALEALGADGIVWRTRGVSAPRLARARSAELREVLINLCENARNASATVVEIGVERTTEHVIVSVADDGEGVPSQLHARVFEPHFSTRTSGSGLGLAISRRLVEGWGGSIDLDSEPGEGTTVRLKLTPSERAPS
jgi:signal transduction histidine kinase